MQRSEEYYGKVGMKEELQIVGIGDALFKTHEKAVRGFILLLVDKDFSRASQIYWKTKQIERVCHAPKDSETLVWNKLVEDAVFAARQIETLIYGDYKKRILMHLYTDSEGMLESKASTKQVERKSLRMVIQDLKERLIHSEIVISVDTDWLNVGGCFNKGDRDAL